MKVLVTGGAGYIGSTICSALADAGHEVVILDSLFTGKKQFVRTSFFYEGDIADASLVSRIFCEHPEIAGVIHCAARIIVPESVQQPDIYYQENVVKSKIFFDTLVQVKCGFLMISSSAALYAVAPQFRVDECSGVNPENPYSRSKLMMEWIAQDYAKAGLLRCVSLRYFNPIGADPQLRTGLQLPYPTHILGGLILTAMGQKEYFEITGTQYPTRDGTGLRDYIHVWDLALAHLAVAEKINHIFESQKYCNSANYAVFNVGRGEGVTVKEFLRAFESQWGKPLPHKESPARAGDIAGAYADPQKIFAATGWQAQFDIQTGIADGLKWAQKRPGVLGY